MCGTRSLDTMSSASDMLGLSVICGMRGVCEMCVCLDRALEEWMSG